MLNQVLLVGKLVDDIEIQKDKNDETYAIISLSIPTQQADDAATVDYVDCYAYEDVAVKACNGCKTGDVIAIKGSLYRRDKNSNQIIKAEEITYLSSKN